MEEAKRRQHMIEMERQEARVLRRFKSEYFEQCITIFSRFFSRRCMVVITTVARGALTPQAHKLSPTNSLKSRAGRK